MKAKLRISVPVNCVGVWLLNVTGSDFAQVTFGGGFTCTDVLRVVDPPLPVQVMLYVVLAVGETRRDPETPDGENPVPLQEVALVDDHDSVDEAPGATP
jgi:hypothetical protein